MTTFSIKATVLVKNEATGGIDRVYATLAKGLTMQEAKVKRAELRKFKPQIVKERPAPVVSTETATLPT